MALTDLKVRGAKVRGKEYKLSDGLGLYLLVTPAGGKLWRLKYRLHGVERKLAFGKYPEVSLVAARRARDLARISINDGDDPAEAKRRDRVTAKLAAGTTFSGVALEYIEKAARDGRAPATIKKLRWAYNWLHPAIGHRPVEQIEPHELLAVLKKQEANGRLETAKRLRSFASRVFRYAVATARAKTDPAALLVGAISSPRAKHFAAIVDPGEVGSLLRSIEVYQGQPITRWALALSPHVFVRPGELRYADWSEIDFDAAVWRIAAVRMKQRREHVVPLSRQSLAIFSAVRELTGWGRLVFPASGKRGRPMSENTINAALRRMHFDQDKMTGHGFRSMASTLLNESGKWSPDAIERALAHKDIDQVRAAYHRGTHWKERVAMAQWWSDYLDILRDGATINPLALGNQTR